METKEWHDTTFETSFSKVKIFLKSALQTSCFRRNTLTEFNGHKVAVGICLGWVEAKVEECRVCLLDDT